MDTDLASWRIKLAAPVPPPPPGPALALPGDISVDAIGPHGTTVGFAAPRAT
jgi:hypothetical protein